MTMDIDRLFTWVDVDNHFTDLATAKLWPAWLLEASAFWDGLELRVSAEVDTTAVVSWVEAAFGPLSVATTESGDFLRLEGMPGVSSSRLLPITVSSEEALEASRQPRWRERRITGHLGDPLPRPREAFLGSPAIVAFHSYKGGVGRTLHAVAAAEQLASAGLSVLLVDGDLEAPGISRMYADGGRRVDVSYVDFLALLHASPADDISDAVELSAAYLLNQKLGSVFILPSSRASGGLAPAKIEPGDLLADDRSPYFLTESLVALGQRVGADVVLVDLRAGISELSAPVLLDPRVTRVFVTTVSDQSIKGTAGLVDEVSRRSPIAENDPPVRFLITQFRENGHERLLEAVLNQLQESVQAANYGSSSAIEEETSTLTATLADDVMLSVFRDELLGLPADWEDVLMRVRSADLGASMSALTDDIIEQHNGLAPSDRNVPGPIGGPGVNVYDRREILSDFARDLAYAETAEDTAFLPTESLTNLVEAHRSEAPLCVVTGAKGAGKTFTQLQMCFRETWKNYGEALGIHDVALESRIVPVLVSANLKGKTADRIDEIASKAQVSRDSLPGLYGLKNRIKDALQRSEPLTDAEWRREWLMCMALSVGAQAHVETVEGDMLELAQKSNLIFVFDGLEDVLQEISTDPVQQRALRSLMGDCVDWLRSIRGRPLGLIVFVRRDLVQAALNQNSAQFLARYREYALKWDPSEAFRLALWVVEKAEVLDPSQYSVDVVSAKESDLRTALIPVWGEKMGSIKSREARSDVWFLAALSDFNQQIQARDIVTFLQHSAQESEGDSRWNDRLLSPLGMRNALVECSRAKIAAIGEESPLVGALLQRLHDLPDEQRQIPLDQETSQLSRDELEMLAKNGVVFREEDQYWIPEIFRHGLGMRANGRPRVLAVANLVRRRNNLD